MSTKKKVVVAKAPTTTKKKAVVSGATSYTWALPSGWSGSSTTATILATPTATSGNITVTANNGSCSSPAQSIAVVSNTLPTPTITASGAVLSTTATYATYQWYLNGVLISGATSSTYTATAIGNYTVTVTDAAGCTGTSVIYLISSLGVSNVVGNEPISIYPNPVQNEETITAPFVIEIIEIMNLLGQVVYTNTDKTKTATIKVETLQAGIYIIKVNKEFVQKMVKE